MSRAPGDVSSLTSMTLPILKSQHYLQMIEKITAGSVGQAFLRHLREIAKTQTITLGEVLTLERQNISVQGSNVYIDKDNTLRTALSDDSQYLEFFWSGFMGNQDLDAFLATQPGQPSSRRPGHIYLKVNEIGQVIFMVDIEDWIFGVDKNGVLERGNVRFSEVYYPDRSEIHSINYYGDKADYSKIYKIGNAYVVMDRWGNDLSGSNISIAYGDDDFGGMVNSSTRMTGEESQQVEHTINVDFYNNNGNLVAQGWGRTQLWDLEWLEQYNDGSLNLAAEPIEISNDSTPERVTVKHIMNYGADPPEATIEIIFDQEEGVVYDLSDFNNEPFWHVIYKPSSGEQWKGGDIVYYQDTWDYIWDSSTNVWTQIVGYYKGYEVPNSVMYFDKSYFVEYQFPLANLLPLRAGYEHFSIMQKEQHTYVSWRDKATLQWEWARVKDGTTKYEIQIYDEHVGWIWVEQGEISSIDYLPGSPPHQWTNYDYWLENVRYNQQKSSEDPYNPSDVFNPEFGDQRLSLNEMSVYYWFNGTNQIVTTPAYRSSGLSAPPYFHFPYRKPIQDIQVVINRLYGEFSTLELTPSALEHITGPFPERKRF